MSGSSSGNQVGLVFSGDFANEDEITTVTSGASIYVCLKETPERKRIFAIVESLDLARVLEAAYRVNKAYHQPKVRGEMGVSEATDKLFKAAVVWSRKAE